MCREEPTFLFLCEGPSDVFTFHFQHYLACFVDVDRDNLPVEITCFQNLKVNNTSF